jgi:hypothetical protein
MPCAADPNPYVNNTPMKQGDYFGHRAVSSPLIRQRHGKCTHVSSLTARSISIPRKPVGSPSPQWNEQSSETAVHSHGHPSPIPLAKSISGKGPIVNNDSHPSPDSAQESAPGKTQQPRSGLAVDSSLATPEPKGSLAPLKQLPFLGKEAPLFKAAGLLERKATAISFRSVSTKQVVIHPPLAQSLSVRRIISLDELPPISLKDPIAARIPSSCQTLNGFLTTWAPPTIVKTEPDKPEWFINTSTITTIGCHPLPVLLPGQVDGANDSRSVTQSRRQCVRHKPTWIPLRTISHQRQRPRGTHKTAFRTHPADIDISSEHHLGLIKEWSIKLCQRTSLGDDKVELKNTPISTSTCRQSSGKRKDAAQNAALLAFQQMRRQAAFTKIESQSRGQLTPPKIRKQKIEDTKGTKTRKYHKVARDVNVDTGNLSEIREGQGKCRLKTSQPSSITVARAATSRISASDKLAFWHPEPSAEKGVGETGKKGTRMNMKAIVLQQRRGVLSEKGLPTPGRLSRSIGRVFVSMVQSTWLVVKPVFDPMSGIRRRYEQQHLTWLDVGLFVAAAMFMTATFLATVILARVVGLGLKVIKALGAVYWLFTVL